jgi:hypothetical protein
MNVETTFQAVRIGQQFLLYIIGRGYVRFVKIHRDYAEQVRGQICDGRYLLGDERVKVSSL